jgi:AcrR family transcriptional regulator
MAARSNQIPSVWARREREAEQPSLSVAAIVREAVVMLDAEGIEALSMRKLGARLNAGATSLYRHVATKDELMELAVDEVFGEIEVPEVPAGGDADWRVPVAAATRSFRDTVLRHPWLASVLGQAGLAYLGPNLLTYLERLGALLSAAGFAEPHKVIDPLFFYVVGVGTTEASWLTAVARSGETEAEFVGRLMPTAREAMAGRELLVAAADDTDVAVDPVAAREAKFQYGLEVVLDGLAMRRGDTPA